MMAAGDLGVALGLIGIGTGLTSLVYARAQARAAKGQADESRRQAEQATRMTVLAANQHVFERLRRTQEQLGQSPVLGELQREVPDLQAVIGSVGSWDDYIMLRKVTEVFQDAYFMRRDGMLTDSSWTEVMGIAAIWAKAPSFRTVFAYGVTRRLVHSEFAGSFQFVLDGKAWPDPKAPQGEGSRPSSS